MARDTYLMSPPSPHWQLRGRANFRSEAADQVNASKAFDEWVALARSIENAGGHVAALPHDDEMTGLLYCAEAGHPLAAVSAGAKPRFLLPRMWAPHRQREWKHWQRFAGNLGFETIRPSNGFWEAQGDVAEFRGQTMLFFGGRSDREGLDAVRSYFPDNALTLEVQQPAFHGNVAVLAIESVGKVLACPDFLPGEGIATLRSRFGDDAVISITADEARSYATNALPVGNTLIAPHIAPKRVLDLLAQLGMDIVTLDMTELCAKAGGASRCLVCKVPEEIAADLSIPESSRPEALPR